MNRRQLVSKLTALLDEASKVYSEISLTVHEMTTPTELQLYRLAACSMKTSILLVEIREIHKHLNTPTVTNSIKSYPPPI